MPLTPNGAATAYATGDDMLSYFDIRTVADLINDTGARTGGSPNPVAATVAADPKLQDALDAAAGLIEAACLRGERYQAADLQGLTGVSKRFLVKLNCGLAMGELWERRPDVVAPLPAAYQKGLQVLEALAGGERIFAFAETEAAGLPLAVVMTPTDVYQQGFVAVQAYRFFGQRGDESPPIPPAAP